MRIHFLAEHEFGNMIPYGIRTEKSTHRVHVCVLVRKVYVFKTNECLELLESGDYEKIFGWTNILEETDPSFCEIHGEKMNLYERDGRTWHSHFYSPGHFTKGKKEWCNGKCEIITAIGYRIPPIDIPGCNEMVIPSYIWQKKRINQYDKLGIKGSKAEAISYQMLSEGHLPIQIDTADIVRDNKLLQIRGIDIAMKDTINIQVKCDYRGGDKTLGGTGFLYIQTEERNPFNIK